MLHREKVEISVMRLGFRTHIVHTFANLKLRDTVLILCACDIKSSYELDGSTRI